MGIKYNNMPKTLRVKFLGLDEKEYETSLTMDFTEMNHNDVLDIVQLQRNLASGKSSKRIDPIVL